jgi:transglutaminase superfamily protein
MQLDTLHRFLRLGREEKRIVLPAATGLACTRVGLAIFGFRRWQKFLEWHAGPKAGRATRAEQGIESARRIAKLQAAVERHFFFRPQCLEHSLVLRWMLQRHGIAANLRFGARKEEARFEAHAWVEVGGVATDELNGYGMGFVPFEAEATSLETQLH